MFRLIPQMATPITLHDLLAGVKGLFPRQNLNEEFEMKLSAFFRSRFCYTVSGGRAALYVILETLKRLSEKRQVVIPVYTCPIVAYAVAKAGLDIVLCDIETNSFGLDPASLERVVGDDTLCVISTHMFGLPCRLKELKEIVDARGVWMIEDAAQAVGASLNGTMLGTTGDFGVISFGAGKNFTPAGGGAILTAGAEWAHEIELTRADLPQLNPFGVSRSLVTLILYSFLIHPWAFGLVKGPVVRMEEAEQLQDFTASRLASYQAAVGISILERSREINETRMRNALDLIEALSGNESVVTPQIPEGSQPTFLRLPVMVKHAEQRDRLCHTLEERGIQARKPFSTLMSRLEGISAVNGTSFFPNAEYVVDRILTLPTHPLVSEKEKDTVVQVFKELDYINAHFDVSWATQA
jgi:perosamine synthetase